MGKRKYYSSSDEDEDIMRRLKRSEKKMKRKKKSKRRHKKRRYSSSSSSSSQESYSSRSSRGGYEKSERSCSRESSPLGTENEEQSNSRQSTVKSNNPNGDFSPTVQRKSRSRSRHRSEVRESPKRADSKETQNKKGTDIPEVIPNAESDKLAELGSEVLQVIGKRLTSDKALAAPVHKNIEIRWKEIFKNGLPKEVKEEIFKKYSLPENCVFLETLKLNPEVKASLQEPVISRDSRLVLKQNKGTVCLGALSSLLSQLLKKEEINEIQFIEKISDSSKILVDLQRDESLTRKSLIQANLNSSLRDTLKATEIDEWLFGKQLEENIKAAKLIQKSSTELKSSNQKKPEQHSKNSKGPLRQSNRIYQNQRWAQTKQWSGQNKQYRRPQNPASKSQIPTAKAHQKKF